MHGSEGLSRRHLTRFTVSNESSDDQKADDYETTKLTLMEEVFLLGLKDREGHTSFWNDSLSLGLRGCIVAELALRGRVNLENPGTCRKSLLNRKLTVKNDTHTGDALLDEALKHIKETPKTVRNWIWCLSGATWNPLQLSYQLKNVRYRVAKNLVEKGVLTTTKQNFLLFDMTVHPLIDSVAKVRVIKKIQEALLELWDNNVQRWDDRLLALILLAHAGDVLDNAFDSLDNDDYDLANARMGELLKLEFEREDAKSTSAEVLWAVYKTFLE